MPDDIRTKSLRILAADEDESTLRATDELLAGLGHEVTAHAVTATQAADLIARDDPDLSGGGGAPAADPAGGRTGGGQE